MIMKLNPKQRFLLWNLLISGNEPRFSDIKPEVKPAERKQLQEAGLIAVEKRGRSSFVMTTDKTWDWAVENFAGELPKTQLAAPLLEKLLALTGEHLSAHHLSLAELLRPASVQQTPETDSFADLSERLLEICLALSGGNPGKRVYLADVRKKTADVPRDVLDENLVALHKERRIVLMGLDDPQSIRAKDEAAVLMLSGIPLYILYLQS
jgi:hypothetical protein